MVGLIGYSPKEVLVSAMTMLGGLLPLLLGLMTASAAQTQCHSACRCTLDSFPTVYNCSHRNLRSFPADIDPQINIIDLSFNSIHWLPDTLEDYPELQQIYLCNNRIESVSNNTFRGLKNLKVIDLAGNGIRSLRRIQADTFVNNTPALTTLNLSRNRIELSEYDPGNIIRSTNLQTLDMSHCGLDDISDVGFLSGLPSIKRLQMSHNNLMWISGLVSETLEQLDISSCKLDSIHPTALTYLPGLRTLDVSRNEHFTFTSGTFSDSLEVLKARSCNVKLENLRNFPNLTHVDLRNNSISIVVDNCFKHPQLAELDLAGNNIGLNKIPPFNNLDSLVKLNLAMNGIHRLAWDTFATNENLKVLNISNNAIKTLVNFSAPSLVMLDVSHCSVSELPNHFLAGMNSLLFLNLSDNKLESLPRPMNSTTLIELNLSFNRLSTLTNTTFVALPKLRVLDLRGNRFTTPFKANIFVSNTILRIIKLTDNPWICDCADKDFQLLFRFLSVRRVENVLHLTCSSPTNLAGQTWQQTCHEEWYPLVSESSMVQRYGVISTVVILCVGGALIIMSAVRRGFKERKLQRRRREDEEARQRALEVHEMMIRRHLENLSRESSPEMRPRSRPRRTPSEVTQPPTYEEALLMTRSQQDLLDRGELYTRSEIHHKPQEGASCAQEHGESDSDSATESSRESDTAGRTLPPEYESQSAGESRPSPGESRR